MYKDILIFGEFYPNTINGVAQLNTEIYNHFSKLYEVDKLVSDTGRSYFNQYQIIKILNYLRDLNRFIKKLSKNKYRLFYSSFPISLTGMIKLLILGVLFSRYNRNSKIIFHIHRGDLRKINDNFLYQLIFKFIGFTINPRYIILGNKFRENLEFYSCPKNIYVVPNFTDTIIIDSNISQKNKFVWLANYTLEKNLDFLIDNYNLNTFHDNIIQCYGHGTTNIYKKRIDALNKSEQIILNTGLSNKAKFKVLSECELLILTSKTEGQPLVILEGIQMGCLIVAPKVGLIEEMFPFNYPLLYEPSNQSSFLSKIHLYFQLSAIEKMAISKQNIDYCSKNFSRKKFFENMQNILNDNL